MELVSARFEPPIAAERLLVLKQSYIAMAVVFLARTAARRRHRFGRIDDGLVRWGVGALVNTHVPVERHDQVGDADRLDDGQDDGALHLVTCAIVAMGLVRPDVEVGDVTSTRPEGKGKS